MLEHFIPAHAYVKVIALPVLHIAKPKNFKRLSVWLREGKADGPPTKLPTPPTTPPPHFLVDSALCSDHGGGSPGGGILCPKLQSLGTGGVTGPVWVFSQRHNDELGPR